MKFFICILIVCAVALNSQASLVPVALNSPILYSAAYGPGVAYDNSHPIVLQASVIPTATHLYRTPLILPVGGLSAEGTYVAKTLGSEHIASLPGHFISTSSINLEQAPGIKKDEIKDSSSLVPSVAVHGSVLRSAFPLSYSTLIAPAPIVLPTEAKYVAKNLGVEHVAPLPGHVISATALNLEPAPGSN